MATKTIGLNTGVSGNIDFANFRIRNARRNTLTKSKLLGDGALPSIFNWKQDTLKTCLARIKKQTGSQQVADEFEKTVGIILSNERCPSLLSLVFVEYAANTAEMDFARFLLPTRLKNLNMLFRRQDILKALEQYKDADVETLGKIVRKIGFNAELYGTGDTKNRLNRLLGEAAHNLQYNEIGLD